MRFILLGFCFFLSGCLGTELDRADPTLQLNRADFQELRSPGPMADSGPPIPHLPLHIDRDTVPSIAADKILSIAVTEKVPLKDVLMELASKAHVDIEIDPRIEGGVLFTATRQPFPVIMKRLCRVAGLRYGVDEGVVHVELDEPYLKTYALDYLSLARKSESQIGIATNVFASVQSNSRNGSTTLTGQDPQNGNNSLTKVDTTGTADFWPEVEANIESILATTRGAKNFRAPKSVMAQLRDEGLSGSKPFSVNRQAGLVNVFATKAQQDAVSSYLDKLNRNSKAQVLIEARIVEVELDEGFQSGINWRSIMGGALNGAAAFGAQAAAAPFISPATATNGVVTLSLNTGDFAGILNFVKSFGATRTLSSPRLTVLNNQPAVLKVARNEVYFTSTIETTPIVGSNGGTAVGVSRTVNSTPNTVPVGFLMNVQPSINLDTGDVTLNLRPTISNIVDRVEDPGIKIAAADANVPEVSSSIPVVAVREMDSVLTLPSGAVAVMGGLMQDSSGNVENGVPGAEEIPLLGNLARSKTQNSQLSELVILLRATIVDGAPAPDQKDKELYKRYTRDRHPLALGPDMDAPDEAPPAATNHVIPSGFSAPAGSVKATEIGYYKVVRPKIPPDADKDKKPTSKKRKRHHRRGASSITPSPMQVRPVAPQRDIPPTLVPQYDRRPDTMPND